MANVQRYFLYFVVSLFIWSPLSWASAGWQSIPETINKSERDTRQYQAIKLDNGMTVLLIEDSQAPKSLAALALPVGSLEDPKLQQGLAHYLEHMILMGSKKYPQPDNFSEYLSKHAGSYNASTAPDRTAYYLEVEHSAFEPAVDRLANAIGEPLLDPVNADRERNAVNAELTMARSSDGLRIAQVEAETINQQHPAAQFMGGNLETLRDKPNSKLQQELTAFYQRYYSANLMVAVLYSNQPISQLSELAAKTLGQIKNNHATVAKITQPVLTDKQKELIIHYVPAKPFKQIDIQFSIANNSHDFRSKTDSYIAYLIGNRSENTLDDWLQKQGLAESIGAYASPMRNRDEGVFTISIVLTDKGLANRDKVVSAVFTYLQLIREKGINIDYFNELSHILDLGFRYPDIERDMGYIEQLVDRMLRVPVKDVIDADYIADQYDAKAIAARLDSMTVQNARIWYISPDEPHNKTAYFVDAPYEVEPISAAQRGLWQKEQQQIKLALPKLNNYIPDDFSLVNAPVSQLTKPKILLNGIGVRALYVPSYYFADEPKLNINLVLNNAQAQNSPRHQVLFFLMNYLAQLDSDELTYQASIGGVGISSRANNGILFSASGFSQRLPQLLLNVLDRYQHFTSDQNQFEQAKSWYLQQLAIADNVRAYEQAYQPVQQLANIPYSERDTRRELLKDISLEEVLNYRDSVIKNASVDLFAMGNITPQQVKKLTTDVKKQLSNKGTEWYRGEIIDITGSKVANLTQKGSSSDSALATIYIPTDYEPVASMALSQVLGKIIQPWFFNQLRTEEQLGYAVFSFSIVIGEQSGMAFLMQSNNQDPAHLYQRYLAFYQQAEEKLKAMSETDFEQYKQGVIDELTEAPQTFDEEAARYFRDFSLGRFEFDTRTKLIAQVKQLTQQQVIQFYQRAILEQQGLSLISQVLGNDKNAKNYAEFSPQNSYPNTTLLQQSLPRKVAE